MVGSLCSCFWVRSTDWCDVKISRLCYAQEISPCNTIFSSTWTFHSQNEIFKNFRMSNIEPSINSDGNSDGNRTTMKRTLRTLSIPCLYLQLLKWNLPLKSSRFSKIKSSNGQFPLVFPRVNNQPLRHRRRLIIATTDYGRRRLLPSWVEFQE